MGKSS
jgi:hypothetical protein